MICSYKLRRKCHETDRELNDYLCDCCGAKTLMTQEDRVREVNYYFGDNEMHQCIDCGKDEVKVVSDPKD